MVRSISAQAGQIRPKLTEVRLAKFRRRFSPKSAKFCPGSTKFGPYMAKLCRVFARNRQVRGRFRPKFTKLRWGRFPSPREAEQRLLRRASGAVSCFSHSRVVCHYGTGSSHYAMRMQTYRRVPSIGCRPNSSKFELLSAELRLGSAVLEVRSTKPSPRLSKLALRSHTCDGVAQSLGEVDQIWVVSVQT